MHGSCLYFLTWLLKQSSTMPLANTCRKYHRIDSSTSGKQQPSSSQQQPTPGTPAAETPFGATSAFGALAQAGSPAAAAVPSSSEDYVLDAMAAALANFNVASKRYADYVPMYIRHMLLDKLPGEVLQAARAEVGDDGGLKEGALEAARKLLTEDRGVVKQRTELLRRQRQLECLDSKMREM